MWDNENQIRQKQELELNLFSIYNMCSKVLPSAPHEQPNLYPPLPQHDFRMQKANEVSAALNAEVVHYRNVAKKYKRAKKAANWGATGCGMFSTLLSGAGPALPPRCQSLAFQLQLHSSASVGHSLLLLQG